MKDVLFYYIRRNEKVKEFLAPFYKGYIYCKEYNRNKCYAIGAIKKLLEVDITQKRIWYFCVPTHSNLGDQAQACCIEKYFRKFFSDHIVFKLSNNAFDFYEEKILMILKEKIKETDLIFFQSGYTFTGIHPYENMHRKIVENFPYNKIVFLPQTVKFKNQKILENVQNFYGKYDNIYFFARDKISYDIYKSIFPEHRNVHCFPDIVTTEIGNYDFNNNERNGILLCVRNDVEKLYSFQEISLFKEKLQNNDKNKFLMSKDVYAMWSKDTNLRMDSTSGGVFSGLAEAVIKAGGCVYGAAFDETFRVLHQRVDSLEGIDVFRGSKYVQSDIGDTYRQIKKDLQSDKWVLFSGTPCQVKALKEFLSIKYNKLLLVDIVCHGVPSPLVWEHYLYYIKEKYNADKIENVSFRNKDHAWSLFLKLTFSILSALYFSLI